MKIRKQTIGNHPIIMVEMECYDFLNFIKLDLYFTKYLKNFLKSHPYFLTFIDLLIKKFFKIKVFIIYYLKFIKLN